MWTPSGQVLRVLLVLQATAGSLPAPVGSQGKPSGAGPKPAGLDLTAAVVLDAVEVRPLPLVEFWLVSETGPDTVRLTTALDGKAHASLMPGHYQLVTPKPPTIRGVRYEWSQAVSLEPGGTQALELTNANARIDSTAAGTAPAEAPPLAPEAVVYDRVKRAVVRVTAGLGLGSGFFVDTLGGLILTNDHVVGGAGPIYVVVDSTRRYEAQRLAHDHEADVAVLRIAADACADCPRLKIAAERPDHGVTTAGERVIAIGFPLHQERTLTSGIVSSVREGAIISDVNINHGNSGGPLLNARGEVLAINTFGDFSESGGPGISGSVMLTRATDALHRAQDSLATAPPPNPRVLPTVPAVTMSLPMLRAIADSVSPDPYRDLWNIDVDPFIVALTTPAVSAVREKLYEKEIGKDRRKREGQAGVAGDERYSVLRGSREWEQYVGDARIPVVTIEVLPKYGETGGSFFKRLMLSSALKAKYTFKGDVRGVTLWRDTIPAEPLLGGHGPVEMFVDNQWVSMKDVADRGYYVFDPRVFRPEADGRVPRITIVIEDLKHPRDRACVTLGRPQAALVWNDFASYFQEHPDSVAFVRAVPGLPQVMQQGIPDHLTGCGGSGGGASSPMGQRP